MLLKFGQIRLLVSMATDRVIMEKTVLPLFLGCFLFYPILLILAGNNDIHESLDDFEIWPDPTTGFHGNRLGYNGKKRCCHFFSAVFFIQFFSYL